MSLQGILSASIVIACFHFAIVGPSGAGTATVIQGAALQPCPSGHQAASIGTTGRGLARRLEVEFEAEVLPPLVGE